MLTAKSFALTRGARTLGFTKLEFNSTKSAALVLLLCGLVSSLPQQAYAAEQAAYRRSDNVNSVVYRGLDNHIHELYLPGGAWGTGDLAKLTGATDAAGAPAGYVRWDNANSVVYRGSDNHIHELYLPRGGGWGTADLSRLTGALDAAGDPSAYRRSDNVNSVVYRGSDNHIHELYLAGGGSWGTADLSKLTGATDATGTPAAYMRSDNVNSVVYRGSDNHIHELYLTGGTWGTADLSRLTGAADATGDPAAYIRWDNFNTNSVVYRGLDGHIHELYLPRGGGWGTADLSALSGAPPAAGNPAGYRRHDVVNSVVYRGTDNHIHEIYLSLSAPLGSGWKTGDLSTIAGAGPAAGDPAAYVRWDNVNSVVYRGFDEDTHELFLIPGTLWQTADLSAQTGATPAYDANKFNFQLFSDNLENNLRGRSVGYSFSVSYLDQWNNMRAGGQARTDADSPGLAMNPEVRFSIASLSKTVTAAAALKLLVPKGSPSMLDNAIGPYLPVQFGADANFAAITFRQLLQHMSGINVQIVDYGSIVTYIGNHPDVSNKKYQYSNTNYALFRFLIPKLANMALQPGDPNMAYAAAYMQYVQQNVFNPVGLGTVYAATDTSSGLDYHFPLPVPPKGMDMGDRTSIVGSEGWVMSTQGLAHFLRDLQFNENILSMPVASQMKDVCIGYDQCGVQVAPNSPYFYSFKGGFYPGCWLGNTGEFTAALMVFSNGVSVALIVNSNLNYKGTQDACGYWDTYLFTPVVDAFNSAVGK